MFFPTSFHLLFAILEVIRTEFGDLYDMVFHHDYFFPFLHYPLYRLLMSYTVQYILKIFLRMSICSSIFLLIGVSVERYLAVCRPHHYREVQGRSNRVIVYVVPGLLAALAIDATKFLEVESFSYCGSEYADNYRDISYRDNLELSYHIDS